MNTTNTLITTLALLLICSSTCGAVIRECVVVDSTLECCLELEKTVYPLGQTVHMTFVVTNLTSESIHFYSPCHMVRYNFIVYDNAGALVSWLPSVCFVTPWDSWFFQHASHRESVDWDMTSLEGELVSLGVYTVRGHPIVSLDDFSRLPDVDIEIRIAHPDPVAPAPWGTIKSLFR